MLIEQVKVLRSRYVNKVRLPVSKSERSVLLSDQKAARGEQ